MTLMKMMNQLFVQGVLCLCCIVSLPVLAQAPTSSEIVSRITNLEKSHALKQNEILVKETQPIRLKDGEQAYLSRVEFVDAPRLYTYDYVLTRPTLNESRIMEYVGQVNSLQLHNVVTEGQSLQLIELETTASGRGEFQSTKFLVYIDGWKVKSIAELELGTHPGNFSDNDCSGYVKEGEFKFIANANYIIK